MRLSKDEYFLEMLKLVAARSTCARRSVGAIITDSQGRVLSMGYNGVPQGFAHCTDQPCPGTGDQPGDTSRCLAVHAEQNALLQCSRLDLACTMYVTCTPCSTCAKLICNTPIRRVVAVQPYADGDGFRLLTQAGRVVVVGEAHGLNVVSPKLPPVE